MGVGARRHGGSCSSGTAAAERPRGLSNRAVLVRHGGRGHERSRLESPIPIEVVMASAQPKPDFDRA
jgi:hypothetical protein